MKTKLKKMPQLRPDKREIENVIHSVRQLLERAEAGEYRYVITFALRHFDKDGITVYQSGTPDVTATLGALERAKFELFEEHGK